VAKSERFRVVVIVNKELIAGPTYTGKHTGDEVQIGFEHRGLEQRPGNSSLAEEAGKKPTEPNKVTGLQAAWVNQDIQAAFLLRDWE
jgi:hypothetical protein